MFRTRVPLGAWRVLQLTWARLAERCFVLGLGRVPASSSAFELVAMAWAYAEWKD